MKIYRIQDKHGRGPFRPGFTIKWREGQEKYAPWFIEWPDFNPIAEKGPREHLGCGCLSTDQLRRWVSESEYICLKSFGYRAVRLDGCRLLRSGDAQSVFARKRKLRKGAVVIALYSGIVEVTR